MADNFTNETIQLETIPTIDGVTFQSINKKYYKVIVINLAITFAIIAVAVLIGYYYIIDFTKIQLIQAFVVYVIGLIVSIILSKIAFNKKQFVLREQDVLLKSGILATNIVAVPINRIQHVTLHEGWISRLFGLVTIKVFTASGGSVDLVIPGIEKEHGENIKFLLMGKINSEV